MFSTNHICDWYILISDGSISGARLSRNFFKHELFVEKFEYKKFSVYISFKQTAYAENEIGMKFLDCYGFQ